MPDSTKTELEAQLENARKEIAYYKKLSIEAGDIRLRETEDLSRLITELKRAEKALQESRGELEKRVLERTADLSKANILLSQEVAERIRAEENLREQQVFLRQSEKLARLGGWKANPETDYLVWTEGVYDIFELPLDYKPGLAEGLLFYTPEFIPLIRNALWKVLTDGTPFSIEAEVVTATGTKLWAEVRGLVRVEEEQGVSVVGTLQDITSRKEAGEEKARLESQLRQSQKMEAIGTLAGGIAHDFNNILTTIMGYGSLLQMSMDPGDPRKMQADQILSSAQKAAILTQSLLSFSRKQVVELKPLKLGHIIKEAEKLLKRLLTEDIEFNVAHGDPDLTVKADVTQMDQVLMNLAANARDAMPGGGKLTIETKAVHLDNDFVQTHGFGEPGDYALISVADTGTGIDRETQEKIFEPFFTTKEVGKGTGLGLSIVYGIVKQHNGFIDVTSELHKGTTFSIYIPLTEGQEERAERVRKEVKSGTETILIAEDNGDVRRLAKEILTKNGYAVIEATDGEDAVQQFMKHRAQVALLILDVVMPRRNGKEAYEEIKRIEPHMRALFTSGYTGDVVLTKGIRDEDLNFISKPLSPHQLLDKVREVLDKTSGTKET